MYTRALWAISEKAEFRFALTGTPIANNPGNLWGIMHFVSPKEYPRKTTWVERYALTTPNPYSGYVDIVGFRADNREELDSFLLPRFLRRPKQAVLTELPPKTYLQREVQLVAKQKKAYDQFRKNLVAQVEDGAIFAVNPLIEMLRLRQLACAFGKATNDGTGGMTLSEPSSKLDEMMAVLEELGDRQLVVFAEQVQLVNLAGHRLEKANIPYVRITGQVNELERARNIEMFQTGQRRVLVATLGSGSEGITLTAADTLMFIQRSWSQVHNKQAEDRIHRLGQESDNVTIIDIVAAGTVDEHVNKVLLRKHENLEELCRDKETIMRWLG